MAPQTSGVVSIESVRGELERTDDDGSASLPGEKVQIPAAWAPILRGGGEAEAGQRPGLQQRARDGRKTIYQRPREDYEQQLRRRQDGRLWSGEQLGTFRPPDRPTSARCTLPE